ncbi:MAG TPA: RHS repeat-associated core domain-containing protein [Steroidobacteraceae bacterium]
MYGRLMVCLMLGVTTLGASATRQVTYYLVDPQGTPLATTAAAGQVLASNDYGPYGREVTGSSQPIGYTGHVADPEIALVYMQQRYYAPDTAIFLSRDPVGPDANSGAHFNRYNYAYSNPYRYTDPDGRCPMCIGFLIGAGIEIGMQWATTGKVDNWTAVAVSGGVGAITGGVGAIAGRAAISGSITVARAATTTALAGGAANAVGKVVEGEVSTYRVNWSHHPRCGAAGWENYRECTIFGRQGGGAGSRRNFKLRREKG